ncbi:DUF554 family protein [Thermophilibacter immobilis]|jgi:uncharacterized membrane protein YqgA involved in biofilm formation|uniref:DUF554 family protein n=1 Tax=Thermophilibacter immobilis TaxID=2779519 RepID=A0A7S7M9D8_9ACTN|nr:DUF554 family protein [Thermophilibacter immobilis]QOY61121.1 DUF554 family protein [Thermophilibacter immobilis]
MGLGTIINVACIVAGGLVGLLGRGCLLAALPVAVLQGSFTALAHLLEPVMTAAVLGNLSLVGSILIFCVGVNLAWPRTFKPANMLPAVVVATAPAFVG